MWVAAAILLSVVLLIVDRNRKWVQFLSVLKVVGFILFGITITAILDSYGIPHWQALLLIVIAITISEGWKLLLKELRRTD